MNLAERGVPHGSRGHNVVHDYTRVFRCGSCSGGVVEHHSHDCWETGDHSSWDMYWWWRIGPADMEAVMQVAAMCPASLDSGCGCAVHEALGGQRTPPRPARSVETPYDKVTLPQARVEMQDGVPRWM
ncbi:hypothetical protein ACFQ07_32865 [Actinomadura adrarensis]|uniref:Uncharacterized protein n=1 Tax=Actinomadura adrarensis TaxID=1819600 RepID=A0ABW3CRJ8_9ACTN